MKISLILRNFWPEKAGATSIEYGLIAALMGVGVIAGISAAGDRTGFIFSLLRTSMDGEQLDGGGNFNEDLGVNNLNSPLKHLTAYADLAGWDSNQSYHELKIDPQTGIEYLDMTGVPGKPLEIKKDVDLVENQSYLVKFKVKNDGTGQASFAYNGAEVLLTSALPTDGFVEYETTIVGTKNSDQISFTEVGMNSDYVGAYLADLEIEYIAK